MCRKELQAVADTNLDDLQTNTGGDIDGMQATSVDATETGGDVQESKQSSESASKESSVEEVSSEEAADFRDVSALDGEEMIKQLKGKFRSSVSRSEKLMI